MTWHTGPMHRLVRLAKQSRPLFWIFTGGLFLLGAVVGADVSHVRIPWGSGTFLALWAWFMLGENIVGVYINDYCDRHADAHNRRKRMRWHAPLAPVAWMLVLVATLFFIGCAVVAGKSFVWFLGFVFYIGTLLYNVPPVRLKGRPIADLSIGPASGLPPIVMGYALVAGQVPAGGVLVAGIVLFALFEFVDKLFDMDADKAAGVTTTAVWLGWRAPTWLSHRAVQWSLAIVGTLAATWAWAVYAG